MQITETEVATTVTSIKGAIDILKALMGLRDGEAIKKKAAELQVAVLESYEKAIAAREAQSKMIDSVRELEEEVTHLKAWDAEKQRYELKSVGAGAVVYTQKEAVQPREAPHWLCANCYSRGEKSFLTITQPIMVGFPMRENGWSCGTCDMKMYISGGMAPQ